MKKVSSYLILIVILGSLFVGYWIYKTYFRVKESVPLSFTVKRGDVYETVSARGEVVAQKKFDLKFPFSGIIKNVYVVEGAKLKRGDKIAALDISDAVIEKNGLIATKEQAEASKQKLIAGASIEDIRVAEEKLINSKSALEDAQNNLKDKIKDAYTKTDDAIRTKTDGLFENPRSGNPYFIYSLSDQQLKRNVEIGRGDAERMLIAWSPLIYQNGSPTVIAEHLEISIANVNAANNFFNNLAMAINSLYTSQQLTQATLDDHKTNITSARTSMSTISASLLMAKEKLRTAEADVNLKQKELDTLKAPARSEDILIADSKIKEIESKINQIDDKISKAVISAPMDGEVTKIWLEPGEVFNLTDKVISYSTSGIKIESDISELNIGKVRESNDYKTEITLDAYPDQKLLGRVVLIEAEPVFKDEDVFYRAVIEIPKNPLTIRTGMSADLDIKGQFKNNVINVPELAIIDHDGKKYVSIDPIDPAKEREVTTGISDENNIEITSGLREGEIIFVHPK